MDRKLQALLVCIVLARNALAQNTLSCTDAQWAWSYNSKGEDPCTVLEILVAPCVPGTNATLASNPGKNYGLNYVATNPQAPCVCNAVVYSAATMCDLCRDLTVLNSLTLFGLNENCTILTTYYPKPFPPGSAIPHWAFLPFTSDGYFDVSAAQADHNPEVTSNPALQSSTSPSLSPTDTGGARNSSSSLTSTSQELNIGAIIGGVVGGVFFFVGVSVSVCIFLRRSRKRPTASTPVVVPFTVSSAVVTPTTPAKFVDLSPNPPSYYTGTSSTDITHQFTQQVPPMQQQPWQGGLYSPSIHQV